jgi:hypothetical protein
MIHHTSIFSLFLFSPFSILCSNNSSSPATTNTTTINYKMIKSWRPIRIASFFPSSFFFSLFFLSDDRSCGEAFYSSICSFIHSYIERICVFLSIIHFRLTSTFISTFTRGHNLVFFFSWEEKVSLV